MSATDQGTTSPSPLVQELLACVHDRAEPGRAEAVAEFARAYTRRVPESAFTGATAEELYAQVMGAFELADGRDGEPVRVRAFNPTLASHGYTTIGTVVETNAPDSPFLVDSVTEEIRAHGLEVRQVIHPVIGTERAPDGRITQVTHARDASARESVMHFETDRRLVDDELRHLADGVRGVLADVGRVVRDFDAMRGQVAPAIDVARAAHARYAEDEIGETAEFLDWLTDGHFVFLGYREYRLVDLDGEQALSAVEGSGLGILARTGESNYAQPVPLGTLDPDLRRRIVDGDLLTISKTNRRSTVHRRQRMDYIGVKVVDETGAITGELRFIGLFTSKAYMAPASEIPLLHRKLDAILRAEDLFEGSHDYKTAVFLFESFPKDELFAASVDDLRAAVVSLLDLQEREHVRLLVRQDMRARLVTLLVALPRDRFNADLRKRIQALFAERCNADHVDAQVSLADSDRAQIHYTVHCKGEIPPLSIHELEREVVALTRTWDDRLLERLIAEHGEARGRELATRWGPRFPDYYKSATDIYLAVLDVAHFEALEAGEDGFVVGLQNERSSAESLTRVGLYRRGPKIALSAFVPILESLGLRVVEEVPTRLAGTDEETYLHDFGVLGPDGRALDLDAVGGRLAECIAAVWRGQAELDSLNRLVVTGGLDWRQVTILRAYRKYRQRVSPAFTEEYQNDAFAANPAVAALLVSYFEQRFDPAHADDAPEALAATRGEILAALDAIRSLDEDRILRGHLGCIEATVRTNAYLDRPWLSFKLRSADVPEMPKPFPLFEIFVYSPEMEGIHLRGGRVARGGIRWSDRREDYRTEVLGLMKAQMVKNAVIVPVGSKGGFVLKRQAEPGPALRAEVERQYRVLIQGMLDLTDNLVDGQVVHPAGIRIHDEPDPYLVVAADKGTAALSDVANEIALAYGFWLGDAFASGGSAGYDHKALGITARGAWESVKRHFRELGVDTQTDPFTVVGIGDMSGDVFGNGMRLSPVIRLVAAFDHRHVFIDPYPDAAAGFAERERLYSLPGSSWDDYDRALISAGGGVYPRSAKSIPISPEARRALGVDADVLTPAECIQAILKAPVDLLWNGGIGTYVKARAETHADVGDRANDAVRVDAADLRCRVVGEGGNLGFTQRGRIEFAELGGRINTDAIDNSGGVDSSDHEVNLKILVGLAVHRGDLTTKQRDLLLQEVTDDVVAHVLYTNYQQAQILSQVERRAGANLEAYEDLMQGLEASGMLERAIEFLPSTEEMAERSRNGSGMSRPELCVLMAYAKRAIKDEVLASSLPDDPYLDHELRAYFPPAIIERFGYLVPEHPLRRELVAMIVANEVVNAQGITFVSRLATETGAVPADVVRAFWVARETTGAVPRWQAIEALDGRLDPELQIELMHGADEVVGGVARWYLIHAPGTPLGEAIGAAREGVEALEAALPKVGSKEWTKTHEAVVKRMTSKGVPEAVARRHAFQLELVHAPDIIGVAGASDRPVEDVARAFYLLGERLHIDWLETRLADLPATSRWRRWAIQALDDDLLGVRRDVAHRAIAADPDAPVRDAVERWLVTRKDGLERLDRLMHQVALEGISDIAVMTVAIRQVRTLLG